MTCNTTTTTCEDPAVATIVQGSDRDLDIRIVSKETGDPFDLTGVTAAKARFENEDGTVLEVLLSAGLTIVAPATNGKISVHLDDTATALLRVGDGLGFEVELTIGANTYVIQFTASLNIVARLF